MARKLRAAMDERYQREMAWMQARRPWTRYYQLQPPVRRWHAVHKASGTVLGPAKNITALGEIILADLHGRPLRPPAGPERGEDPHRAALEWVLGRYFEVMPAGDGCLAVRRVGGSHSLTAGSWDELRDAMLRDLSAPARVLAGRDAW